MVSGSEAMQAVATKSAASPLALSPPPPHAVNAKTTVRQRIRDKNFFINFPPSITSLIQYCIFI
jgi:hypothetical protein